MRYRHLTALASVAFALCVPSAEGQDDAKEKARKEAAAKELRALAGTWEIVAVTSGGQTVRLPEGRRERWAVRGNALTPEDGTEGVRGTLKVDPAKLPKALDITPSDGPFQGKAALAIYELKGEELRVCTATPGQPRPTEFSAPKGSSRGLVTYRRVKPKP